MNETPAYPYSVPSTTAEAMRVIRSLSTAGRYVLGIASSTNPSRDVYSRSEKRVLKVVGLGVNSSMPSAIWIPAPTSPA